eukprot:CAMPEP_0196160082 /NCGR_PEP_ID=MMETSP0910-20130528/46646_1 /TAXON_ID=49265 /ORGANISM="Thalassiosira rotula, Strain GSO102" /LENGTH=229 /DNA_ID=CAMNT_0041425007 /DNA_START=85 /DNA_END=774 /DNA_ORIENTATION=-
MKSFLPILTAAAASIPFSHAFHAPARQSKHHATNAQQQPVSRIVSTALFSENDEITSSLSSSTTKLEKSIASSLIGASILLGAATSAFAVSGGGLDYAGLDISGQDYSNGNYKGKDFTQVLAKATNFAKSNLQGCRFYNSFLTNANYEGADIRGVSFERAGLEGVNFKNAVAGGAYFDQSLSDVASIEGGDFTDAQMPDKTLLVICEREDAKGTNPTTGVDTRDSLMCL